jgi:hypothetical protein
MDFLRRCIILSVFVLLFPGFSAARARAQCASFASAANYAAGTGPVWVAAGDFNHDGKLDLAVADGGGGRGSASTSTTTPTPAGTYTLTATGTTGSLSHKTSVTLKVQ